jgi:serine/threonine protein kinase
LQRTTVLAVSPRVTTPAPGASADGERDLPPGMAVAGGRVALPGLHPEERLLLGFVDGRLSVGRIARVSGLSEEAALRHLGALCARRILVPVETPQVTIRGAGAGPLFRLGAYEVTSRIGQGGMGSVYACRRTGALGFRRMFAIKVVRNDSGQEQAAERSFAREIQIGGFLDHPNVQSVLDVGSFKGQPYLVLQLIDGASLDAISLGQPVPPDILATVLIDMLRGLQSAHDLTDEGGIRLGLVHADVSPPNILVGTDGVARLTDFGSARFTALGEGGLADPMIMGKPAFMAPEQLVGEPLDARTDIFATGVVMWTMLTGRHLFAADSYEQIIQNVGRKRIEPPSLYGAPACFDAVCLRALSRSRDERYGSAEQMAGALLAAALSNGCLAPTTAVAAFVRRRAPAGDIDLRRQIGAVSAAIPVPAQPSGPVPETGSHRITASVPDLSRTVVIPERMASRADAPLRRWPVILISAVLLLCFGLAFRVTPMSKRAAKAVRHFLFSKAPPTPPPPPIPVSPTQERR